MMTVRLMAMATLMSTFITESMCLLTRMRMRMCLLSRMIQLKFHPTDERNLRGQHFWPQQMVWSSGSSGPGHSNHSCNDPIFASSFIVHCKRHIPWLGFLLPHEKQYPVVGQKYPGVEKQYPGWSFHSMIDLFQLASECSCCSKRCLTKLNLF